jgi:hypothetical protein
MSRRAQHQHLAIDGLDIQPLLNVPLPLSLLPPCLQAST